MPFANFVFSCCIISFCLIGILPRKGMISTKILLLSEDILKVGMDVTYKMCRVASYRMSAIKIVASIYVCCKYIIGTK